ncbi:PAS domain S-box protein [Spirulina sp. CS-785/01]|uniref:PAS domain S-box protein n=1 Tax=Spirulina sp. CS-785/01 TaxID=3021716 RepID=UPI00232F5A81|nr:PAS domain S-box protein [Spirulina sp. CS-785/01]MDB9315221.1 PAS domain S-box protein [Spirulina sp. CS-785/01]
MSSFKRTPYAINQARRLFSGCDTELSHPGIGEWPRRRRQDSPRGKESHDNDMISPMFPPVSVGLLPTIPSPMQSVHVMGTAVESLRSQQPILEATLSAIAAINTTGGVLGYPLQPQIIDTQQGVTGVLEQVEALFSQTNLRIILGGGDATTRKHLLPLLEQYNALLWYPGPNEGQETASQVFYTGTCPNQPIDTLLNWLQEAGYTRCYLLHSRLETPYSALLQGQLRQNGWLVGESEIETHNSPLTLLNEIRDRQPDIILNTCGRDSFPLYTELTRQGISPDTLPIVAFQLQEADFAVLGESAIGHYLINPYCSQFSTPENEQFLAHLNPDTPLTPTVVAAYTQVYLWQQAVELAQTFAVDRVRQAAYGINYAAPQGRVQIAPNQYLSQPCYLTRKQAQGYHILNPNQTPLPPLPYLSPISEPQPEPVDPSPPASLSSINEDFHPLERVFQDYIQELLVIFRALDDTIFVTDAQGCYLRIAPTHPTYPLSPDLIGKTVHEVYPPDLAHRFVAAIQQTLDQQETVRFEYCLEGHTGHNPSDTPLWFNAVLSPILPDAVIWIVQDITTRKQIEQEQADYRQQLEAQFEARTQEVIASNDQLIAEIVERQQTENALINAKDQLQAILEAVPGIVSWISSDLRYLGVNRHLAETFGLTPEDFIDQDIGFLNASSEFIDFVSHFFQSPIEEDFQEITTDLEDGQRTFLIVAQKYDNGQAAFTVGIDVTERQQAVDALERSKDQLQAVLDAVPGIVSWISADLHYLGVNRHLARTFDLNPEDFAGRPLGFLDASEDFNEFVHEFFNNPQQVDDFREVETIVDDEVRNYLIAAQKYDNGQAAFTVGIDVTERQRALEEVARSKDQLQAVLEAVPGIVSWISADLHYLGVNRHLAQTFNLPVEAFAGKHIGFLQASEDFNDFVRAFFASPQKDSFREVEALVKGEMRNYLIAAQKYDNGQAAFTVGIDVTERQRALEALQKAETKYRTIFENAIEGIFQTTPDGKYISANPALARIYGYDSPEQLMAELDDIQAELYLDRQRREKFVRLMETEGGVVGFESQIRRRDGTICWISENARVVQDLESQCLYYEGTVEDITERKEAEEALRQLNEELEHRVQERTNELQQLNMQLLMEIGERERIESALRTSEAELKALFAAMTDVITVFNQEGCYEKIVNTNSELVYSPKVTRIGKNVYDVLPPEKADLFLETIHAALETGKTVNTEYSLIIPLEDGSEEEVWFAASISPLPNRSVIWVARNITERKRVLDALQEAEEKYRSIFENAAEGIFQSTRDGKYLNANPALVRMYGYDSFADMVSHVEHIDTDIYAQPELRKMFREQLEQDGVINGFKAQVRRKDGSLIWTSENARVVRDEEGEILYYEGTVADITKQKQAEDALWLEQEKSERLLRNILPNAIAERLKQEEQSIAERFDSVSILFADIVDFTSLSAKIPPTELVDLLNDIFSAFDQLAEWYDLEKIKTIGDSYMVAGGIPSTTANHAEAIADMALDMQLAITRFSREGGEPFRLRIGIHTGQVVAGVIGIRKFIYDLWGDTVNVASRMESQGVSDMIQVTQDTYELLKDKFFFEKRGEILVKGRGKMTTYWLRGRR